VADSNDQAAKPYPGTDARLASTLPAAFTFTPQSRESIGPNTLANLERIEQALGRAYGKPVRLRPMSGIVDFGAGQLHSDNPGRTVRAIELLLKKRVLFVDGLPAGFRGVSSPASAVASFRTIVRISSGSEATALAESMT
jgi:hypothetical protein